jgi:hypothetical protein
VNGRCSGTLVHIIGSTVDGIGADTYVCMSRIIPLDARRAARSGVVDL